MKKKVLIVDDEPNILMSLEYLMRKNEFEVFIARNGAEALELLSGKVPDLILLDIMMPDVDGYEICMIVKQNPRLVNTKVIFLSAKSKITDIEKGYDLGADLYITKPFSTRALLKSVNELLTD
jgi:two-component system, OmpR family, alkaline phosphatase synthesis response regulator PhoP